MTNTRPGLLLSGVRRYISISPSATGTNSVNKCKILFTAILLLWPCFLLAQQTASIKASFIPQWVPQAQFAGYYTAYELGFYRQHGIDLTIIPGGPDRPSSELLKTGKADLANLWLSTAIQERAAGVKLVNIAQMVQRSALLLIAKKSRGINTLQDLDGRKVGLWGADFRVQPMALFAKYHLNVQIVPQTYSVNLFLRDGVDVTSAMWYNEYHTILNAGLNPDEITTFFFHDYGLNFPEDGIYIMEETLQEKPGLACAFVKASIDGWLYAFEHQDEAIEIILKYLAREHLPANRMHQKWMLQRMKDVMMPLDIQIPMGCLTPNDYQSVAHHLKEYQLIESIPDFHSFRQECTCRHEKK
jgi:NitT/TauT family transport system substrate-binding protein